MIKTFRYRIKDSSRSKHLTAHARAVSNNIDTLKLVCHNQFMNKINKAYKYRFYPTPEQKEHFSQVFGCVRYIYNWGLKTRADAFYERGEKVGYHKTCEMLTELKKKEETKWLFNCPNVCLQQSLRNLDAAFANFFKKTGKYPSFKKKSGDQSCRYTTSGFRIKNGEVWLAKTDAPLKIRWSRPLPEKCKLLNVTISKDCANRYFISFSLEEDVELLPVVSKEVGIDLGLKEALIMSDGSKVSNPKFLRESERKLAKAQRRLSRKVKGSKNRIKAKLKVAKIHAKIADQRKDWQHKVTTQIANENQVLSLETLRVKNLLKNPKLAKAISDVSWGEIVRLLEYKSTWKGRTFIQIDQWYPSSKRCSHCGYTLPFLKLETRSWECPECKTTHDRDLNASINILKAGKAILNGADKLRVHE